jgi:hypothetical protein
MNEARRTHLEIEAKSKDILGFMGSGIRTRRRGLAGETLVFQLLYVFDCRAHFASSFLVVPAALVRLA